VHYAKRFAITSVTRDKEYDITTGADGSTILWFTANHNGEAETVKINLRPKKGLKKSQLEWDFSSLAIKGRSSRGNLVTKYAIAKIQLKSKGISTIGGKEVWWDADIQRLNEDGRGEFLGEFTSEDRVLAIFRDGTFYTTNADVVNKYQGEVIYIGKWDPALTWTALYWDGAAKAFYVKRFSFPESDNNPLLFISEGKGSRLVDISSDMHPQVVLTFGGKVAHREPETLNAEEFIAKKGYSAKGKKCHAYELAGVAFGEPLHYPEDDVADEEISPLGPEDLGRDDNTVIPSEVEESVAPPADAPSDEEPIEMELTGTSPDDLPADAEVEDWTLF